MERTYTNSFISVLIYLYNRFDLRECVFMFGGSENDEFSTGPWIWHKWNTECNRNPMNLLNLLDNDDLEILVTRAMELYDGRKNLK